MPATCGQPPGSPGCFTPRRLPHFPVGLNGVASRPIVHMPSARLMEH
jgi:hypothetical protein